MIEQLIANQTGLVAIGAGIAIGLGGIAAGIGESGPGPEGIRCMVEDKDNEKNMFAKTLVFLGVTESPIIYSLVVVILMLFIM